MKQYVDGFVFTVPRKNLKAYQKMAAEGAKMWMDHGALQYVECIGDDLKVPKELLSFPKLTGAKKGEVVCFSWIRYKSKAHSDRVNKKVMADPRMAKMPKAMPFDPKKMAYAGFVTLVNKEKE